MIKSAIIVMPLNEWIRKPINNLSVIETAYMTAKSTCDRVIIAADESDAEGIQWLYDRNLPVYPGDKNIVKRLIRCALTYQTNPVMVLRGDCGSVPIELLYYMWKVHETTKANYVSNTYTNSYPYGVSVDILDQSAMQFLADHVDTMPYDLDSMMSPFKVFAAEAANKKLITASVIAPYNTSMIDLRVSNEESFNNVRRSVVIP